MCWKRCDERKLKVKKRANLEFESKRELSVEGSTCQREQREWTKRLQQQLTSSCETKELNDWSKRVQRLKELARSDFVHPEVSLVEV